MFDCKKMKKALFIAFLICGIGFVAYNSPSAFAQGKEWQRIRRESLVAKKAPAAGKMTSTVEYFITYGDIMEIFVWQNPDLSKDVIVGPDGKISYPLVGRIQVAGLSIGQLEEKMTEQISKYVKYPQVSIMMKEFAGNKIIILGEVNYPGIYTYKGAINLIEAIALAGDFTERAREDSIVIVSGNLTEHLKVTRINISRVIKKGTSETDIVLKANDVIYVPKSFIGNLNKFLSNISPSIDKAFTVIKLRKDIRNWSEK